MVAIGASFDQRRATGHIDRAWLGWVVLPWVPGMLSPMFAICSMVAALAVQRQGPRRTRLAAWEPAIVNGSMAFFLLAIPASMLAVGMPGAVAYARAVDVYTQTVEPFLSDKASSFSGRWSLLDFQPVLDPATTMANELQKAADWSTRLLLLGSIWLFLTLFVRR